MTHTPENLLTVWADVLLDALAAAGVRDVVVSPGSRSTPFVLAATRHPELTLHSVVDERSAGFYALGLARAGGPPPLLLCTSGTAAAHYYPAVIEASEASLPLIALTADRPSELSGTGAPQTTDQTRLYGVHARAFTDLGDPHPRGLRGLARAAARAVEVALGPAPGPVQLNARARKPLEPILAATDAGRALAAQAKALRLRGARSTRPHVDPSALVPIRRALERAERPAIVAGPLGVETPRDAILDFARRWDLALLAEATSQVRFARRDGISTGDGFEHWIGTWAPDLVIEIGATPTAASYARWLETSGPAWRFVLGGERFRDPSGTASGVILGDLDALLRALPGDARHDHGALRTTEERTWAVIDEVLGAEHVLGEASAVRRVIERAPAEAQLALGNSLPVRHADRFVRCDTPLRVLHQRGVNGIDGWIAGCAGAAAAARRPTLAIVGDVAFFHDVGSLALAARATEPLVFVVLDNGGGRIFEQLPIARRDLDLRAFTTPPAADLGAVARAFGLAVWEVCDSAGLDSSLDAALELRGASLIRVRVPPHGAADQLRTIRERALS